MSLEQLILKYIDGELDSHEDEKLRTLLRDDLDAKDIFESHVELNHAMQEDAKEIDVPDDLYNETEDLILMKIMAEEPNVAVPLSNEISDTTYGHSKASIFNINSSFVRNSTKYISYAAALFIIFFGVRNIDDSEKPFASGLAYQNETLEDNKQENSVKVEKSNSNVIVDNNHNNISENKDEKRINVISKDQDVNTFRAFGSNIQIDEDQDEIVIEEIDYSTNTVDNSNYEDISKPIGSTTNSLYLIDDKVQNIPEPVIVVPFNNEYASEVFALSGKAQPLNFNQIQITSFAGMDYFRKGLNTTDESAIAHLSQSIAYASSERNRFGIEFGFTEYTVFNDVNVTLPDGILIVIPGEGGMPDNNEEGNESSGGGSKSSFDVGLLEVEVPVRFFWGTAFYERTLLDYKGFSLDGRIAAGASAGGPMAYVRFFAKQRIIKGIYFTIGTEGRIFKTDHPIINSDDFNSSASLIYGIQFSF